LAEPLKICTLPPAPFVVVASTTWLFTTVATLDPTAVLIWLAMLFLVTYVPVDSATL
jgi:hypothetical protein